MGWWALAALLVAGCGETETTRLSKRLARVEQDLAALKVEAQIAGRSGGTEPIVPVPAEPIDLTTGHLTGAPTADVVLAVFSDFHCPYCAAFARQTLPRLHDRFVKNGRIRVAFLHYPARTLHPEADEVARIAACTESQEMFWPLHDKLFGGDKPVMPNDARRLAIGLGIPSKELSACEAGEGQRRIADSLRQVNKLGLAGTPTIMIGRAKGSLLNVEQVLMGQQSFDRLSQKIGAVLARNQ
jgi:protein-disulfide isomerase